MSKMPGQGELLKICFSCLRYSRIGHASLPLVRPANIFVRGGTQCMQCRFVSSSQDTTGAQELKDKEDDSIQKNPFYEKYKAKLSHLAASDPDEYKWRLKRLEEDKSPKQRSSPTSSTRQSQASSGHDVADPQPVPHSAGYVPVKGLDSVMKLELIQDKSPAEVEQIWKEYHKTKDCVFAVLERDAFEDLMTKGQSCPTFLFPLPRDDGHEFILMQFDGKDLQFTPLSMYQILKENAPACLSLVHYTELIESKGIVLMSGQYDDKVLKREDAVLIVQMMAIYYGKNSPRFHVVQTFNHNPEKFDYNQLIEDYKGLYLDKPPTKCNASATEEKK